MELERGEHPDETFESVMALLDDLDAIRLGDDDDESLTTPA